MFTEESYNWLRERIEDPKYRKEALTPQIRKTAFANLVKASNFENFLAKKFGAEKRFGLDGVDAYIPGVFHLIDESAKNGMTRCNIGMAHRGRLNVLTNMAGCPYAKIFSYFQGGLLPSGLGGSGDVPYHLGGYKDIVTSSGKTVRVSLVPNASHLETAAPLASGKTLMQQELNNDVPGDTAVAILIHGDSAAQGQGSVYELTKLTNSPRIHLGGTYHIVANNQIGYTTIPEDARSQHYCTSLAKAVGAPVFHVNAHDVDAVIYAFHLGAGFKYRFKSDVVIDVIGYRKHGHNEGDEPRFTQPIMYKTIDSMKSVLDTYAEKLKAVGVISESEVKNYIDSFESVLEKEFEESKKIKHINIRDFIDSSPDEISKPKYDPSIYKTGLSTLSMREMVEKSLFHPKFKIHPNLEKLLRDREKEVLEKESIGWSSGELITICTLLQEGTSVRITGPKANEGFSNTRHYVLYDHEKAKSHLQPHPYVVASKGTSMNLINIPPMEYGSSLFETGVTMGHDKTLIIWEAPDSSLVNAAQVTIDNYISSSLTKWGRSLGLVMQLYHSTRGKSPNHANSYIERFLQLCTEDELSKERDMMKQLQAIEMVVAEVTTPANYFHLIRRHVKIGMITPLILYLPQSFLLRTECTSKTEDFDINSKFHELINDNQAQPSAKKHIICCGEIYYDLVKERNSKNLTNDITITRLEQLCPFPFGELSNVVSKYKDAKLFWVQEEPKNFGAWSYVEPRVCNILGVHFGAINYIGPPPSAHSGYWSPEHQQKELARILEAAFKL